MITQNICYEKAPSSQISDVLHSKWPEPRDLLVLKEGLQYVTVFVFFFQLSNIQKLADYHHYL